MNLYAFLHLALGAYFGVSLRIHIIELVSQHMLNGAIPLDIIDNFLGSFIIGFYNDKYKTRDFESHLAISTGFCGCLTTFSSWIIGNILLIKQNLIFDSFMNLFIGISIAYCGYKLGQEADLQLNFPFHKKFYLFVILTTIFFQIVFLKWNIIIAALLGPLGALFRYHLSKLNSKHFPFGTFLCNFIAVIIAAILTVNLKESSTTLQIGITIVIRGFCGGFSTVSTFIKELCTLEEVEFILLYLWISIFLNIYFGCLIIQEFQ